MVAERRTPKRVSRGVPEGGQFAESARTEPNVSLKNEVAPDLERLLQSAARIQELVPDAVLVGGAAAGYHARHRSSVDHDHVVQDLLTRVEEVLHALETDPDFNLIVKRGNVMLLGDIGGIATGIRQLRRQRPLEVVDVQLRNGQTVRVPTIEEIIRIKAYLVTFRNQARDYLDLAALTVAHGAEETVNVLYGVDDYYTDINSKAPTPLRKQLAIQLAQPAPKDPHEIERFKTHKDLHQAWHDWQRVVDVCQEVAAHL